MTEPRRTNLTVLPTSFVGRRDALSQLAASVDRSRLVTILGPPGTGKTRLAKEHALAQASRAASYAAVLFCDLTDASSPDDVIARLASVLGIGTSTLPTQERIVQELLAIPSVLLILDNFEQLVRSSAPLVAELVDRAGSQARFLVTSRERLGIAGEALFDLGPLVLPSAGEEMSEAVQLFVERARDASPDFRPSAADLRDVAQLVSVLDGLPLALELAAARVRILTPAELLERLGKRFEWLTHGRATLRDTIEASWSLLAPWEQDALCQVSVFRGGFTVGAAESTLDLSRTPSAPPILDVLQSLRDKSLLQAEVAAGSRRFALLSSIREFSEDKLDEELRGPVYARHARTFLRLGDGLVARLDVEDDAEVRRKLRLEHENFFAVHRRFLDAPAGDAELNGASLRAALILSKSAGALPYAASIEILDRALAARRDEEVAVLTVARALEARGNLLRFVGRTRESIEDFENMLRLAESTDHRELVASALSGLGNAATVRARWAEAGALFERALAIVEASNRRVEGRVLSMLAATHYNRDDPARARVLLLRALDCERESKDRAFEGISVTSLGIVSLAMGAIPQARTYLAEGLVIHREVAARHWEGVTLSYLAAAEQDDGRMAEAHALYASAIRMLSEIEVKRALGVALAGEGSAFLWERKIPEAKASYLRALDIARVMSPDHEGLILAGLAVIAAMEGDLVTAADSFEFAERAAENHARPALLDAIRAHRGHLEIARRKLAPADEQPAHLAAARLCLEAAHEWSNRSADVRFAQRLLARELAALEPSPPSVEDRRALVVGVNGAWFRTPGSKTSVRLHRRRALQRLLEALSEQHARRAGEALSIAKLVELGWPGERVLADAGTERVYTAVATLRKLGLRKLLLQRDDGYLLDPSVSIVRSAATP